MFWFYKHLITARPMRNKGGFFRIYNFIKFINGIPCYQLNESERFWGQRKSIHLYEGNSNPLNAKLKKPHLQTGAQSTSSNQILPCLGYIVDSAWHGIGLRTGPCRLHTVGWRPGTTTLCQSRLRIWLQVNGYFSSFSLLC